ncbi:cyclin-D4-1-like isoform X2 [Punica granatum]|uniref:Cyclin-D4-1-like isoform X2 n=2 Tax=Punica granatum TaxID=22663 RepID=A0A6P8DNJ7_PUNGR|nr:cyclin-D4-1-like isoform X2 [Punica granatum]PKI71622.1 hypothetical protein CRG98_007945 [Punica granatum]
MPPPPEEHYSSSLFCGEDPCQAVSPHDPYIPISDHQPPLPPPLPVHSHILLLPPPDEAVVGELIDRESRTLPQGDYLHRCRARSINLTARQDSISWILKVHAHYHFRPVTALLAVNYLDRFLSVHSLPEHENGWPFQLLSVACLSLAAKIEELYVPLLLDLQICDPKFVFEPKTVQRMELWVMANLDWRLHSVTPFDFLNFFVSNMQTPSTSSQPDPWSPSQILASASDLILRTPRAIDFLGFTPSEIAAAAVLSAAGVGAGSPITFHERVNKEMVRSCHQLMEEYLVDTCPTAWFKHVEAEPAAGPPPSPVGVLDAAACGSCDTRPDNPSASGGAEPPPPPNKRLRLSAPDVQEP